MEAIKVKLIGLSRGGGGNLQLNKNATPTEQQQIVQPDPGYDGLRQVTVEPIPDEYADVSDVDATASDVRVGKVIVDAAGQEIVGEMLPEKPEQVKSATPTTSAKTILPDTGYALSQVNVGAIPSEYADVSDVTATAGTVLTGSDFVDASGTLVHGSCDYDADTSDATATAGQIESGATAYVNGAKITGSMPIRTADVEIDSLTPVPIPVGSYDGTTSAKLSAAAAASVVASVIKQGAEILGVQGSYVGTDTLEQYFANTLTSVSSSTPTSSLGISFNGKTALESASFPNLTSIGASTFQGCSSLHSINFPSVTSIGVSAFQSCTNLTMADFPSVTTMNTSAFFSCSALASINFPLLTSVPGSCFFQCDALTSAAFPVATLLDGGSMRACPHLEIVDLGACTNLRNGYVFRDSSKLKTLIIRTPSICATLVSNFDGTPFANGGTGGTIYIPETLYNHLGDGTSLDYKAATNWSVIDAYGTITWAKIEGSQYEVTP